MAEVADDGNYYAFEGGGVFTNDLYTRQGADQVVSAGAESRNSQLPDPDEVRRQARESLPDVVR